MAAFVAAALCVGGFAGAWLPRNNDFFNEETLRLCFGLIMMYVAFNLIVSSDAEATKAAVGLTATVGAWLAYLGLRVIGKRSSPEAKVAGSDATPGRTGPWRRRVSHLIPLTFSLEASLHPTTMNNQT